MLVKELVTILEETYPNDVMAIDELTEKERIEYVAVIKMIAYIKLLNKDK